MPYKSNSTNQQSKENHGNPAGTGQPKAESLPVNQLDPDLEDRLEQEAADARQRHPNRNLDKPDIDKPAYS
ncbi:hypothetical protein [Hymenobacter sp. DG25A]|jgi:hypothetical protein|uniref:hypothetical protein n=1 Tax=Hymenobacter sp. DG25A TaxID=1385663 RepID=UPI0006BDEECD|nr:hypothetical protein [Hymenobacter sp. DG25A]ALD22188.1 hypothetical protein AM218_14430 [Hymenobacter sp. DG25A]